MCRPPGSGLRSRGFTLSRSRKRREWHCRGAGSLRRSDVAVWGAVARRPWRAHRRKDAPVPGRLAVAGTTVRTPTGRRHDLRPRGRSPPSRPRGPARGRNARGVRFRSVSRRNRSGRATGTWSPRPGRPAFKDEGERGVIHVLQQRSATPPPGVCAPPTRRRRGARPPVSGSLSVRGQRSSFGSPWA